MAIIPPSLAAPSLAPTLAQTTSSRSVLSTQQAQVSEVSQDQYIAEQKAIFESEYKKISEELAQIEANKTRRGYSTPSEDSRINFLSGKQSGLDSLRSYLDQGIEAKQLIGYAGEYGVGKASTQQQITDTLNTAASQLGQTYSALRSKYESGTLTIQEAQALSPQVRQQLGIEIVEAPVQQPTPSSLISGTTGVTNLDLIRAAESGAKGIPIGGDYVTQAQFLANQNIRYQPSTTSEMIGIANIVSRYAEPEVVTNTPKGYVSSPVFTTGFFIAKPEAPTSYPSGTMQGYGENKFSLSTDMFASDTNLTGLQVPINQGPTRAEIQSTKGEYASSFLTGLPIIGYTEYLPEYAQRQRAKQFGFLSPRQVSEAKRTEEEYLKKEKELNKLVANLDKELADKSDEEKQKILEKYNLEIINKGYKVKTTTDDKGYTSFTYSVPNVEQMNLFTYRGYIRKQISGEKAINLITPLVSGEVKTYRKETIQEGNPLFNTIQESKPLTISIRPKNLALSAGIVVEEAAKTYIAGELLGLGVNKIGKGYNYIKSSLGGGIELESARFLPNTGRVIGTAIIKEGEETAVKKTLGFLAPKVTKTAIVGGTAVYGALEGARGYTLASTGQTYELQNFPYEVAGRVSGFALLTGEAYRVKKMNEALREEQLIKAARQDIKIRETKALKEAVKSGKGYIPSSEISVREIGTKRIKQAELDNLIFQVKQEAEAKGISLSENQIRKVITEKGFYETTITISPGRAAESEIGTFGGAGAFKPKVLKRYGVDFSVVTPEGGKGISFEFSYNKGKVANVVVKESVAGKEGKFVFTSESRPVRKTKLNPQERFRMERTLVTEIRDFQRLEQIPITRTVKGVEQNLLYPVPEGQKAFAFTTEQRVASRLPYGKTPMSSEETLRLGLAKMSDGELTALYEKTGKTRAVGRFTNLRIETPVAQETGIPGVKVFSDSESKFLQLSAGRTDYPLGSRLADVWTPQGPTPPSRAMKPFSPPPVTPVKEEASIFDRVFGPVVQQERAPLETIRKTAASQVISPKALSGQIGIPRAVQITEGTYVAPTYVGGLGKYRSQFFGKGQYEVGQATTMKEELMMKLPSVSKAVSIGGQELTQQLEYKQVNVSKSPTILRTDQTLREAQIEVQQSKQSQPQVQQFRQIQQQVNIVRSPSPRIGMPMEVIPELGKPGEIGFGFKLPDREKKFIKKQKAYVAEVYVDATKKQKAHYEPVTEQPLTLMSALSAAARVVDRTISARGRVREVKTTKQPANTGDRYFEVNRQKFRSYSGKKQKPLPTGTFIEKQKYRADSPGETMALQKGKKEKARIRNLFGM